MWAAWMYGLMMWLGLREYDRGYDQALADMQVMDRSTLMGNWLRCENGDAYDRGYKRALMGWER